MTGDEKWDAWVDIQQLSKEEAMERYVERTEQHERDHKVSRPLISEEESSVGVERAQEPAKEVSSPVFSN